MSLKPARFEPLINQRPHRMSSGTPAGRRPGFPLLSLLILGLACLTLTPARPAFRPQQGQSQEDKSKELQKQMQEALQQFQKMAMQGLTGGTKPWSILQQQCTALDKQNPLFLCLSVKVTIIDDINGEVWYRKPSGLLPTESPNISATRDVCPIRPMAKGNFFIKRTFPSSIFSRPAHRRRRGSTGASCIHRDTISRERTRGRSFIMRI